MNKSTKRILSLVMCLLMLLSSFSTSVLFEVGTVIARAAESLIASKAGDINGDSFVNNKDLTRLMRFISGEDIDVARNTVDVNGDDTVNNKDLTRLMRYLSGDDVEIKLNGCTHEKEKFKAVPATCTKDGNSAYWYCSVCDKYFGDENGARELTKEETVIEKLGHNIVVDPYVAPTYEQTGLTDGEHCSKCDEVLIPQTIIPKLKLTEYAIEYKSAYNNDYLANINFSDQINDEKRVYSKENGLDELPILETEGYNFIGWFDGSSSQANRITEIPAGTSGNKTLYGRWEEVTFTITFDSPSKTVESISDAVISKDTSLPGADKMQLYGYKWLGWSDDSGELYTSIYPAGKCKNVTLHANYQSYRNQAVPVTKLGDPSICIDDKEKVVMFTFELGKIKCVPLYVIDDYGKMIPGQPKSSETVTCQKSTIQNESKKIAETIAKATTQTSTWTLSNSWNKISSVSESHCEETGIDIDKIKYDFQSETSELRLTEDNGETTDTTINWGVNAKIYGKNTLTVGGEATFPIECVNVGVKAENTTEIGGEASGYYDNTEINHTYWNTAQSYDACSEAVSSETIRNTLSQHISDTYNVSTSVSNGSTESNSEGYAATDTRSNEYSSMVAYTTEEISTVESYKEYTASLEGWWRHIKTADVNVYGVVSYDMETCTYTVYTYNVVNSDTISEYMDYDMSSGSYDTYENGFIPFTIPVSVNDYISKMVGKTKDLTINRNTGIIEKYNGNSEYVHIPDYFVIENKDKSYSAIKVVGISENAFENKTNLKEVRLSSYIDTIPDNAFNGCSSLETITYKTIKSIGNNAFAGCTSLESFTVDKNVISIGDNAFENVPEIIVYASNSKIVEAATSSNANNISIYLKTLNNKLSDVILVIPEKTSSFNLYGRDNKKEAAEYKNVVIDSSADSTVIDGMTFINNSTIPLKLNSNNVTLSQISVMNTTGLAMVCENETTNLYLCETNDFSTSGKASILCKNINIYKDKDYSGGAALVSNGLLLHFGMFNDEQNLFKGNKEKITEDSYSQYLSDTIQWTLASSVPNNAIIIDTKYTYDLTEYKSSSSSSMSGWTKYDTKRTSWGTTQGPVYSDPSNGSRNVWSERYETSRTRHYKYYHRYVNSKTWCSDSTAPNSARHTIDLTYALTDTWSATLTWHKSYKCPQCGASNMWLPDGEYDDVKYGTRWYYQEPVYTYYYKRLVEKESTSDPSSLDNVSNVQKWVKYIAK